MAAVLSSCVSRSQTQRTKITVEVDTPAGLRAGYSVFEDVMTPAGPFSISDNKYSSKFRGEAVAVDLPGGRTLFALLHNGHSLDMANLIGRALYPDGRNDGGPALEPGHPPREMRAELKGLAESGLPLLVTFRDVNDPMTIEKVDPANLAATFGSGVQLKRITVAVTGENVTSGEIAKRLQWLQNIYNMGLGPDFKPKGIPLGDFKGLFSTEISE
jgi:hypothetical protein